MQSIFFVSILTVVAGGAWPCAGILRAQVPEPASNARQPEDPERLRRMLAEPGPDGAEARATAIERLLGSEDIRCHSVLQQRLAAGDDPDGVRVAICEALVHRLRAARDPVFGEDPAQAVRRTQVLRGYLLALAPLWRGETDADGLLPPDPLRDAARAVILRMPARELELGLRALAGLAAAEPPTRPPDQLAGLFRLAADTQNLAFAAWLAEYLQSPDQPTRRAAQRSLRLLTFANEEFQTREQFDAWFQQNGRRRYVDLAEEAARRLPSRVALQNEQMRKVRRDAAVESVRALIDRRPGVDWTAVRARVIAEDPSVTDACLEQLRGMVGEPPAADADAAARLAFHADLLREFDATPPRDSMRRARLLEVAALLLRAEEAATAAVLPRLLQQLAAPEPELRLAAVRGLRRQPVAEARAALVAATAAWLQTDPIPEALVAESLRTLASATWFAPSPTEADEAAWFALVRGVVAHPSLRELRDETLALVLRPEASGRRPPNVFDLLLGFAQDASLGPEFRTACLIHLQDWRDTERPYQEWLAVLEKLLADPEREIRLFAAGALGRAPKGDDARRREWNRAVVATARDRILGEQHPSVVRALADVLVAVSQEPEHPALVIGALNHVLEQLGSPVPPEQHFRLEILLQTLATVAADARADKGQWVGALDMLLKHEKRRSLRHVLESHDAGASAQLLASADPTQAERARRVLLCTLRTALLKPERESWRAEELRAEVAQVRAAFAALGAAPDALPDARALLMLRMEIELAADNVAEVVRLARRVLESDPGDKLTFEAAQKNQACVLLAEGHLIEGKPALAAQQLERLDAARLESAPPRETMERLARAFLEVDPAAAVVWAARSLERLPEDDPAFRARFVLWLQARVKADPGARPAVLARLAEKAALFEAGDCPADLKEAVAQLRGGS
jgi:hypothetical protein